MPHQAGHTWGDLWGDATGWWNNPANQPLKNLFGTAGQVAATEKAIRDLKGLGSDAKEFMGFPTGVDPATGEDLSLYQTVKGDTSFKPFSVTGPYGGNVGALAGGGTTFTLSPEQQALEQSLRTGGESLIGGILGRGQGAIDPATGLPTDNARSEQAALINMLEGGDLDASGRTYRGLKQDEYLKALRDDPFSAESLATGEQQMYDRLRELRIPEEERAKIALQQDLIAGGRQGLRTAQFGGSPEELALAKAMEEQKSADSLTAMTQARADAQRYADQGQISFEQAREDATLQSDQRLAALRQQREEKQTAGDLASMMLEGSYMPGEAIISATQPSQNLANIAGAADRQMGGFGRDLGISALDYDLGAREQASELRREQLSSIFDLLIAEQNRTPADPEGSSSSSGKNFWEQLINQYFMGVG